LKPTPPPPRLFSQFSVSFYMISFSSHSLYSCQPVEEPEKMTQTIVEAVEQTGQRGIINKGWGGLGNCKFLVPPLNFCMFTKNSCYFLFLLYSVHGICIFRVLHAIYLAYFGSSLVAEPKDFIYLLDNCPHDWLFLQCKAVVRLNFIALSVGYNA